jgi:hypothetical protein
LFEEFDEKYQMIDHLSVKEHKEKYPRLFDEDKLPFWYPKR